MSTPPALVPTFGKTRCTVHAKGNGATVEVRAFILLGRSQWHRMGTWSVPTNHYRATVRSMLGMWAHAFGTEIDESAAAICIRDLPPIVRKPAP